MAILELLRTLGALALVLGLLAAGLWAVKRYNIALPGRVGGAPDRRLELVERIGLDGKRSAVLLRRDGREHLVILAPEGNLVVESGDAAPRPAPQEQESPAAPEIRNTAFAALVDHISKAGQTPKAAQPQSVTAIVSRMKARSTGAMAVPRGQKVH